MASPAGMNLPLQDVLEQLDQEELSKFKALLRSFALQNELQQVPHTEMEEASARHLAEMLPSLCPGVQVETVATQIFKKMNRTDLYERAKSDLKEAALKSVRKNKSQSPRITWAPRVPCANPSKVQQPPEEKPVDKYRSFLKMKLQETWKGDLGPRDTENLPAVTQRYQTLIPFCDPKTSVGALTRTVVLHGSAGVGKTMLAKRCLLDWTESSLGPRCCAFYLSCRELNHMAPCTFAELISKDCPELQEDVLEVLSQAERVLFVVDGFDELRVPAGSLTHGICSDWRQQRPAPILLSSLLKRKMVAKATLLVTTRPGALRELLLLVEQPLLVEVEGFSEGDLEAYFLRHFGDQQQALRALDALRCNPTLLRLGSAPPVCWLLSTCLKLQMEGGEDPALSCQTSTSLFLRFLCGQFTPVPGDRPRDHLRVPLEALCLLAAQGLWTQLSLFDADDLGRLGVEEADLHPFLEKRVLERDRDCVDCFSFIHLSVQQFLAAAFYVLKCQEEGEWHSSRWDIRGVRELFSREARAKNPRLAQAGCFLLGLLNTARAQELGATFGCQMTMEARQELLRQASEEEECVLWALGLPEAFHCLHESQDQELVRDTTASLREVSLHLKSIWDLVHSSFCLKHCEDLQGLSLQVAKGVLPAEEAMLEPDAQGASSGGDGNLLPFWTDLCSVFSSNKNLVFLDMSQSFLSTPSVRVLCEQVASATCRLQRVLLKDISPAGAYPDFCLAFRGLQTLTQLSLRDSELNEVLPSLCGVLSHPRCRLQWLRLGPCAAPVQQWADLFSALQVNHSLRSLDLSDSELLDEGAQLLCRRLRHPKCPLQRLSLENCHLTEACCSEISATLIVNQRLTHLCLAKNDLGDGGVKTLCEGLRYPECGLQTLVLWHCGITSKGCSHLAKVLGSESSLAHLDLGLNHIGVAGLQLLCESLKEPPCGLQSLWLWGCALSPLSCADLSSALRSNRSLLTLDLGQNRLGFEGVKTLCEALKPHKCPLQALRLKIDESDARIQDLLRETKESNPQLAVDSDRLHPQKHRPSSQGFLF